MDTIFKFIRKPLVETFELANVLKNNIPKLKLIACSEYKFY